MKLTATTLYVNFLKDHCSWDAAREDIQRMVDYLNNTRPTALSPLDEKEVWVVGDCWAHEGYSILGIFASEKEAKAFKSLEENEEKYPLKDRRTHWVIIEKFKVFGTRNAPVLPERKESSDQSGVPDHLILKNKGFNACLDEVRRLNGLEERQ